jgi:hypothetical protein
MNKSKVIDGHKYCRKCDNLLPITEFKPNLKVKSGLNSHCKDCVKSHSTYIKKLISCEVIDGHKHCSKCKELLPVDMFKENPKVKSGLHSYCNICKPPREKKPLTENKVIMGKKRLPIKIIDGKCVCNKCNIELPISEFYKRGDRIKNPCKKCSNERKRINHKKWRQTEQGRVKLKESKKRYKQKLSNEKKLVREQKRKEKEILLREKELRKELRKEERLRVKDLKLQKSLEHKKLMEYYKTDEWKEIKKRKNNERHYIRWKRRWENDELFAMKVRLRNLIRNSFRKKGYVKFNTSTEKIVGMNYNDFKVYLESKFLDGMSWENRGEWHIDHIIPLSSAKSEDELISLSHYSNLQPLWAEDNLKKGSTF